MATKLEFEILNTHSMYVLLRQSPHGQTSKRCTTVLYNNLAIRTKQQTRYIHLISSTNVIFKKLQATIMAFQCAPQVLTTVIHNSTGDRNEILG